MEINTNAIKVNSVINKRDAMLADSHYQDLLTKYGTFYHRFMFESLNKDMGGQELLLANHLTDGINTNTYVPIEVGFTGWYELQSMLLVSYLVLNPGCRVVVITAGIDSDQAIDDQMKRIYKQCTDLIIKFPWLGSYINATQNGFNIDSGSSITFKKAVPGDEAKLAGENNTKMITVVNNADCLSDFARYIILASQAGLDNRVVAVVSIASGDNALPQGVNDYWNIAPLTMVQEG